MIIIHFADHDELALITSFVSNLELPFNMVRSKMFAKLLNGQIIPIDNLKYEMAFL